MMMKTKTILLFIFLWLSNNLIGQVKQVQIVEINALATTHIKFPASVTYVDVGNSDVLIDYFDNIVKLKAKKSNFKTTSFIVLTENDKMFVSDLSFNKSVDNHVISVTDNYMVSKFTEKSEAVQDASNIMSNSTSNSENSGRSEDLVTSENLMQGDDSLRELKEGTLEYIESVFSTKYDVYRVGSYQQGVYLNLRNVYTYDDYMIVRVSIENTSNLTYTVDLENIFVKDRKQLKRSASQDISVPILARMLYQEEVYENNYTKKNASYTVGPKSDVQVAYVLDKFNSSRGKKLSVEISESGSERRLDLSVPMKYVKNAKLL